MEEVIENIEPNQASLSVLESNRSKESVNFGQLEYFDTETEERYIVPYTGKKIYIGYSRDCYICIDDDIVEERQLSLDLGPFCELLVRNVGSKETEEDITINGEEILLGKTYHLRQSDQFYIYRWGVNWIPSPWYLKQVEKEEKAKIGESFTESEAKEDILEDKTDEEDLDMDKTILEPVCTPEKTDLNETVDLISFQFETVKKQTPSLLQQLELIRSGTHKKMITPRRRQYANSVRKSLISVASGKSYMEPTENSIRRQRPKQRKLLSTPNFKTFDQLNRDQQLRELKKEAGSNDTPRPQFMGRKSVTSRLKDLAQVTDLLKAEIASSPTEQTTGLTEEKYSTPESKLASPPQPQETIVEKMSRLSISNTEMQTPRYNLRSTAKKAREPRYSLRSACKKRRETLKKMKTPLKKEIQECKFNNIAYLDRKKLATPLKKEIKKRAGKKPKRNKMNTPFRKQIEKKAQRKIDARVTAKAGQLKTPIKKELIEEYEQRSKARTVEEETTEVFELAETVIYEQSIVEDKLVRMNTPLKTELHQISLKKCQERLERRTKVLKTPLRTEVKAVALKKIQKRAQMYNNRLATPIRAELKCFNKTMLQKVETIIESMAVDSSQADLFAELRRAVAPTPKPLERTLLQKMEGLLIGVNAKQQEKSEKEALAVTLKKIFAKGLGDEEKVEKYFNDLFQKDLEGIKEWMNAVVSDSLLSNSNSPDKMYYSAVESESELRYEWKGQHKYIETPQKPTEIKPIRVALEQFTDFEGEESSDDEEESALSDTNKDNCEEENESSHTVQDKSEKAISESEQEEERKSTVPTKRVTRRQTRASVKVIEPVTRRSTRLKTKEVEKENIPIKKNVRRKTVASKKKPKAKAEAPLRRSRRIAKTN